MGPTSLTSPTYSPTRVHRINYWWESSNNDRTDGTAGRNDLWVDSGHDYTCGWDNATSSSWYSITATASANTSIPYDIHVNRWVPQGTIYVCTGRIDIDLQGFNFQLDPKERKRQELLRRRMEKIPQLRVTRFGLGLPETVAEAKARELLRSFIGGERFRRYLKDGFITVKSPRTGLIYQIFPGHKSVIVRDKGRRTASCCIVFKDHDLPPTDWVVMRLSLIVADETTFYEKANVSGEIPEQIRRAA